MDNLYTTDEHHGKPNKIPMPKSGYWYMFTYYECPVCGASDSTKERVYDRPKPENFFERHEYYPIQWCSCTYY